MRVSIYLIAQNSCIHRVAIGIINAAHDLQCLFFYGNGAIIITRLDMIYESWRYRYGLAANLLLVHDGEEVGGDVLNFLLQQDTGHISYRFWGGLSDRRVALIELPHETVCRV